MSGLFSDLDKWQLADVRKRQKTARRVLAECGGIVEGPVRVEAFTGGLIAPGRGNVVTDWHIVDARGRTVHVVPFDASNGNKSDLRRRAARYAQGINEVLS